MKTNHVTPVILLTTLSRLNTTAAVQVRASRHKTPKEPKGSCSLSRDRCPLPNKATPGPTTLSPCVCVFPTQCPDRRTTRWSHHLKHVCLANGGLRSLVLQHNTSAVEHKVLNEKRDQQLDKKSADKKAYYLDMIKKDTGVDARHADVAEEFAFPAEDAPAGT